MINNICLSLGMNIAMLASNNKYGRSNTPSDAASNAALAISATNVRTGNFRTLSNGENNSNVTSDKVVTIPLIWRITCWFESIIDALVHPKGVNVYNEKTQSIIPLPTNKYTYITTAEVDSKVRNRLRIYSVLYMC